MSPVGIVDLVGFLAILTALAIVWRGWKRALERDAKSLLAGLLALTLFHSFSNTLEWSGITKALDPLEDNIQVLAPMLWGFFFYAFLQTVEITERKRAEEEVKRRNQEMAALNAIATTMIQSALDLDEVLQRIANGLVEGIGCNTALIFLLDEKEGVLKGSALSTKAKTLERINAIIGVPVVQLKIPARSDFNEALSNALDGRMTIKHDLYELAGPLLSKPVCSALRRLLVSKTFLSVPLQVRGKMVGGIFASTREELGEGDTETIMTFANQAAIAIENARLYEENQRRLREMNSLLEVSRNVTSTLELDEVLRRVIDTAIATIGPAEKGTLHLLDEEGDRLVVRASVGFSPETIGMAHLKPGEGYTGWVFAQRQPLIVGDVKADTRTKPIDLPEVHEEKSALCVPLVVRDRTIGTLTLDNVTRYDAFVPEHLDLLSIFASQATIAIENARLYEAVQQELTERKRAEAALKEYSERLEEMVDERTQELRDAQEKLMRQEKLAVLGQLAGGVAHELRNPLGAISNAAYFLNMVLEEPQPEVKEALEIMKKELGTSERIISSLLDFARTKVPTQREVDVNDLVADALPHADEMENVEVMWQLEEALPVLLADPDQLVRVFGNLMLNAAQAMPNGGRLTITTEFVEGGTVRDPQSATRIQVSDTGVGIPEENLDKLFEPLFTTKAKGIGLGLALVKTLVEANGGSIEVESEVGKGSTFTVRLQST